jgi:glyoxylase-like metal-dependent hydrolase (beta-lactamase superfamily II)
VKLTRHIALVGSSRFGLSSPYDCSVYAIDTEDGVVLIDVGCGLEPELIEANLRNDGFDPARITTIVLTHAHADHAGGSLVWKERTGCRLVAPQGSRPALEGIEDTSSVLEAAKRAGVYPTDYVFPPVSVDVSIGDGETLAFGNCQLHAIQVAGHTPHHTCYWTDLDGQRVLFSGDAVFYSGSLLLLNVPGCSMDDYRRDIEKLAGLDVDILLPGHGIFVMRFGQDHLNRAIDALHQMGMPANFTAQCPKIIPKAYRERI